MSKTITIRRNGPYVVKGGVPLAKQTIGADAQGESVRWVEGHDLAAGPSYELCRCGQSENKPFCDGSHARTGFNHPVAARDLPPPKPKL